MTELKPELRLAAQALGESVKKSPAFVAYQDAIRKLEADEKASQLLDELQRVQADIRARQSSGTMNEKDVARLGELQGQVQSNRTISVFMEAEQIAALCLPELNQAISEMLGIDFAALGRVKTC